MRSSERFANSRGFPPETPRADDITERSILLPKGRPSGTKGKPCVNVEEMQKFVLFSPAAPAPKTLPIYRHREQRAILLPIQRSSAFRELLTKSELESPIGKERSLPLRFPLKLLFKGWRPAVHPPSTAAKKTFSSFKKRSLKGNPKGGGGGNLF